MKRGAVDLTFPPSAAAISRTAPAAWLLHLGHLRPRKDRPLTLEPTAATLPSWMLRRRPARRWLVPACAHPLFQVAGGARPCAQASSSAVCCGAGAHGRTSCRCSVCEQAGNGQLHTEAAWLDSERGMLTAGCELVQGALPS